MRRYAAEVLGKLNDISALKALEYVMKNDPDEKVRKAAFEASAKIRSSISDYSTNVGGVGARSEKPFSICPYCGEELKLPKTPKFCPYCGDKLME